jgi:tetratricopeptide (TPR) repeat protein
VLPAALDSAPVRTLRGWITRAPGLALLAVALAAAAALYAPTIDRGLVNYDDPRLYTENFVVQRPSLASVRTIFFDLDVDSPGRWSLTPEYLPVRDLSVMLDYAVWGDAYAGFHLTNVLLYLAAIALVFAMLDGFGIDRKLAGVAVLLWALHPTHAESVAWLSERKGVLAIAFAAAAGAAYARFRAGRGAGWLAAATLATVAAVWSKAPAAFAIAALAGLELVLPARRASRRRALVGLGAMALAGGLAFAPVLAMAARAEVVGGASAIPGGRLAAVLGVHGHYLEVGAMAVPNAITYPIASAGPTPAQIAIGALGLGALAAALAWRRRVPRAVQAAAVIWVLGWLPVSHLVLPLHMVAVADRYAMLMTLGAALAAAVALARIPSRPIRAVAIAAVAVLAAARAVDAQATWGSPLLLWERAVASDPSNPESWSLYAEALASAGRPDLAEAAVDEGLRHHHAPRLLMRRALLLLDRGDRAGGLALLRQAAEEGEPRAMANLALAERAAGRRDEALRWARLGAERAPRIAHNRSVRGLAALDAGLPGEALAEFRAAHDLEPGAESRINLAIALLALGRPAEAIPHLEGAAADPAYGDRARLLLDEARRRAARVP